MYEWVYRSVMDFEVIFTDMSLVKLEYFIHGCNVLQNYFQLQQLLCCRRHHLCQLLGHLQSSTPLQVKLEDAGLENAGGRILWKANFRGNNVSYYWTNCD